jgi:N-acetylmuramoyl-L-alanine amidase
MATKIYIDQGHNPVNPNAGAEGQGYREQDVVFRIGLLLANILERRGFETRLSRQTEDVILGTSNLTSLQARVNAANAWGADYFISLHTNASANPSARGSEALVYNIPSVASELAEDILVQLNLNTGIPNRGVTERRGLYVLRKTQMPATLLELGFITNPTDARLLANSPELFAQGIADGITEYLSAPTAAEPYLDREAEGNDMS